MRGVPDVEQESVALAGAARQSDRGVQRDVVALRGPRARTTYAVTLVHDALNRRAQRRAVGRGRRTSSVPRGDDAVQQGVDAARRQRVLLPEDDRGVSTLRAPFGGFLPRGLDVRRHLSVLRYRR